VNTRATIILMLGGMLFSTEVLRGEGWTVLPDTVDGAARHDMMKRWILLQMEQAWKRWQERYEQIKTPEQIADYQKQLRAKFVEALGGFPERTPLNTRVTGVVRREGYRIEKVLFESQPQLYVTGVLFLPDSPRFKPPYPGVLIPCGHSADGKAHKEYQTMGALLSLHGMVALVFDPIDQGERYLLLDEQGKPRLGSTSGHTMCAIGSALLGRNTARYRIWDAMRAMDVLCERPEVDPQRMGCTGNSGGGTETSYMLALEDRIRAASPSCYIMNFNALIRTIGAQDGEQCIAGQIGFGMDHPDYLMMRAPTPVLIAAATKDFFNIGGTWETFRLVKRMYTRMGCAERVDILENDAGHNYNEVQRQGVLRWMSRWLLRKDEPLTEPPITPLSDGEIRVSPKGQVMLIEGARTVYDLNEDYEKVLASKRQAAWAGGDRSALLEQVRRIAGIRKASDLPRPSVEKVGEFQQGDCRIEKLVIRPEPGIHLPALLLVPANAKAGNATLVVSEAGIVAEAKAGGTIEPLLKDGQTVLAVDVRGSGQTQQTQQTGFGPAFGSDWADVLGAYLLGRSYVGMRAEDILTAAKVLTERTCVGQGGTVQLVAVGNVGVPALHAAALEPSLFGSVRLVRTLVSWSNVVHNRMTHNQLINMVHGALVAYDLPDLVATLGEKIKVEQPLDACGRTVR